MVFFTVTCCFCLGSQLECQFVFSWSSDKRDRRRFISFTIFGEYAKACYRVVGKKKDCVLFLKVHKHEIFFFYFYCRNRNNRVPRACNTRFLKIVFELAEIFDF
jgi:hypothetical protein